MTKNKHTCARCHTINLDGYSDYCRDCLAQKQEEEKESHIEQAMINLAHESFTNNQLEVLEWIINMGRTESQEIYLC